MYKTLFSKEQIANRIQELAKQIVRDYKDAPPLLICVLRGSFIVASDLIRALYEEGLTNVPIEFIQIASYGETKESNRNPYIISDVPLSLANKHVLVIEDIIDTGYSMAFLKTHLEKKQIASLKLFAFLDKKEMREAQVTVDYVGFTVEGNEWIVGYGLNDDTTGRGKPDIAKIVS